MRTFLFGERQEAGCGGLRGGERRGWTLPGTALALAVVLPLVLGGCSSKPPTPEWQMNASASSDKALEAYLSGNTRVEALEWDRARAEVARTGRLDLMGRLELLRCAAQLASLDVGPCVQFEPFRPDATAADRAYADYLAGRTTPEQVALLPPAQRATAGSGGGAHVAAIADPLSRLVAAGAALQAGRVDPQAIAVAVDTASQQGWRRPLLAWLGVQHQRAEDAGDTAAAEMLRRRMAVVGPVPATSHGTAR